MLVLRITENDRKTLAGLRVAPEQLADDGRDYAGQIVMKPWGREREIYKTADSCAWRLELEPRAETSMHCHTLKTVVFFLSDGYLFVDTLAESVTIAAGGSLVIEPGVFHRARTIYGATLIEVESPPNRNDIVRLDDKYGRVGKPYSFGSALHVPMECAA